ncbi:MAG: hypothetical protein HC896_09315 [Bacteroidales bacterium]|nr:hypothetical protein [Bacteroidales bacterium]
MQRTLVFVVFCLVYQAGFAKKIGEWTDHLSYNYASDVVNTADIVYCATSGGIIVFDKRYDQLSKLSTVNGLSDVNVAKLAWDKNNATLVVAYTNANIDLLKNGKVANKPQLKIKQITGDKTIYNVKIINNKAYLCTGIGLVILDHVNEEFGDTYILGENGSNLKVNDIELFDGFFYAATSTGLKKALANGVNLLDYNNWQTIADLPMEGSVNSVVKINNLLFALHVSTNGTSTIYSLQNNAWGIAGITGNHNYSHLFETNGKLASAIYGRVVTFNLENETRSEQWLSLPKDFELDGNTTWIADTYNGLLRFKDNKLDTLLPDGPGSNSAFKLYAENNTVYMAIGAYDQTWTQQYFGGSFYTYNDSWQSKKIEVAGDVVLLKPFPGNQEKLAAGCWNDGVVIYQSPQDQKLFGRDNLYEHTMTYLGENVPYIRVSGLQFDTRGNLWVYNVGVENPLNVYTKDGKWISMKTPGFPKNSRGEDMLIDQRGNKWCLIPRDEAGIYVFNEGADLTSTEDDQYNYFNVTATESEGIRTVHSIAEDKDGHIWVGTDDGVVVYYNTYDIFDSDPVGSSIIIPRKDGSDYADILFDSETILDIAIDGGNRKWFATGASGVFLMSPDGQKEIVHLTKQNSPLGSDQIYSLALNDQNGELFIGTNVGLFAYNYTGSQGNQNFNSAYVYPNPVREDYYGPIVVKGLMEKSVVKITDIAGNLVNEIMSSGAEAEWNGKNFDGRRPATGVYLMISVN